ncbi:hypothetical protein F5B20DRAFT_578256 [Whalleya microplaca]|nr:hypothetical protein F5B20DRAFT_578256 [Whalleya microplaca]
MAYQQLQSPLMRMPPEILNEIYSYCAVNYFDTGKVKFFKPRDFVKRIPRQPDSRRDLSTTLDRYPALLKTCRRIHNEAQSIIYQNAEATLSGDKASLRAMVPFTPTKIRNLSIVLSYPYSKPVLKRLMMMLEGIKEIQHVDIQVASELLRVYNRPLEPYRDRIKDLVALMAERLWKEDENQDLIKEVAAILKSQPKLRTLELSGFYTQATSTSIQRELGVKVIAMKPYR